MRFVRDNQKASKKRLAKFYTNELLTHSHNLGNAIAVAHSNNIIKSDTFKSIVELRRSTDARSSDCSSCNMRQKEIKGTPSTSTHESATIPLPHRTSTIKNEKLTELIGALPSLYIGQHASIRENEDEHVDLSMVKRLF